MRLNIKLRVSKNALHSLNSKFQVTCHWVTGLRSIEGNGQVDRLTRWSFALGDSAVSQFVSR